MSHLKVILSFAILMNFCFASAKVKVAIIGAGLAGTKTADLLKDLDIDLDIYESEAKVGGRSLSREVTLSNGVKTTVNTGTMFVFDEFFNMEPELLKIKDLFTIPSHFGTVVGKNFKTSKLDFFTTERNPNPGDTELSKEIGNRSIEQGHIHQLDSLLSSLALYKFNEEHLKYLSFYDLMEIFEHNPAWDEMTAEKLVANISYDLQPHTAWGDWFTAYGMWRNYQSTPPGPAKAKLSANILENGLYYGTLLSPTGQPQKVDPWKETFITERFKDNFIEPMEYLVDFTSLSKLSAIHFVWQLKWMYSSGRFVASKNWNQVPVYYLEKNKNAKVHLNHRIEKIDKLADGKFELSIKSAEGIKKENFDIVINTADTNAVSTMNDFAAPELKELLDFNEYTSTIGLFIESDKTVGEILGDQYKSSFLAAAPDVFNDLGGITFQTAMYNDDLQGHEIIGLFAKTESVKELLDLNKSENWSNEVFAAKTKSKFLADLRALESSSQSIYAPRLRKAIETGKILFVAPWANALPSFAPGYMKKVSAYRKKMGKDGYFYLGQAVYGRSAVMVISGVKRDIAKIRGKINKLQ